MKLILKDFQDEAVDKLGTQLRSASAEADRGIEQAVVLSAPTGSGKTVMATTVIERLFAGDGEGGPDDNATVLWITRSPELNEQTREKMIDTSDVLGWSSIEVIDSSFDEKAFLPHRVYFLNTDKLGKGTLLTQYGDERTYTIWDTIRTTLEDIGGGHFYVFIDEAHQGMSELGNGNGDAQTIIQKFIKGSVGQTPPIPLIVGISATPGRFTKLVSGTSRILRPVHVDPEDVRESGLLKDVITLYNPAEEQPSDISMLRAAAQEWMEYQRRWEGYTTAEGEAPVEPILVVQVRDATKTKVSATSLGSVIDAINDEVGPFPANVFAQAFQERETVYESDKSIRYLAPSKIARDPNVKVVLFKTALSTGWDCPRAEVILSFRKAKDETLIAQLVGRMVRTPLARRVDTDEYLNTVALYLPHYDAEGLQKVVDHLSAGDPNILPPTRAQLSTERVSLVKRPEAEEAFVALEAIPSYTVPKHRKISQVRRMMKLARALSFDHLNDEAVDEAEALVVSMLEDQLEWKAEDPAFQDLLDEKGKISLAATDATLAGEMADARSVEIRASEENISDLYNAAGRRIGEGLHKVWWRHRVGDATDKSTRTIAKLETYALLSDDEFLATIEGVAQRQVAEWLASFGKRIGRLQEGRRQVYAAVRGEALVPEPAPLEYPESVEARKTGPAWEKHLYVDESGGFHASLNKWEAPTIDDALADDDLVGWMRNPSTAGAWTFTVPYKMDGLEHPMRPDFLAVRSTGEDLVVDVLDPHDPTLDDAPFKAVGLAAFARDHGAAFGRIHLIAEIGGDLKRLDLQDEKVRNRVLKVRDSAHLVDLYASV